MPERNPNWTRDELILALEFYKRYSGNPPHKQSDEIRALSDTLNLMSQEEFKVSSDFRNPNGVYMKIMNFRSFDPAYISKGLKGLANGGKLDEEVWNDFAEDSDRLKKTASAIRSFIGSTTTKTEEDDEDDDAAEAREGKILSRVHTYKERDRKIIAKKKKSVIKSGQRLACECCSFDFAKIYGPRGNGFIEVHHLKPIFELEPNSVTKLDDLALVCANCHRMIHAKKPWLSLSELRQLLQQSTK